jgi:glycosyltransferase involved in cell wall biosynthesis
MHDPVTELQSAPAATDAGAQVMPAPATKSAPERVRRRPSLSVLMLGPDLNVRGGVSSVERLLMGSLPAEVSVNHIGTMVEGTHWQKIVTFARALVRAVVDLRKHPHVVHIHFASGASNLRKMILAQVAMLLGAKVIMHAHGAAYRNFWARMSAPARAATRYTLGRVSRLIVLGDSWAAFFISAGVPRHKIVVLPNPVVLPASVPDRRSRTQVRFVFLGEISRRKGAFDLLEAIAQLSPQCTARARFVIAGNRETARLREMVVQRSLGSIVEVRDWIGPQERDELLASADAFVLPSYAEGLPMALLETMAWGLPPICTPVGSISELVCHGTNGLIVQPGDAGQLARAIEQMTADDERRLYMGKVARATVEPLAADLYAQRVSALYRSVAHR